jgi:hypothetical protein
MPAGEPSEGDLDRQIVACKSAEAAGARAYWDLGRALFEIHARKLWRARLDTLGNPVHRSWGAFCTAELGISGGHALRVMDVATRLDRTTAMNLGVKKAHLLLRLPDAQLRKHADRAVGMSYAELAAKVNPIVAGTKRQTGRKVMPAGGGRRVAEPQVTQVKVPLFVEGSSAVRARKLAQLPNGVETREDGTQVLYSVVQGHDGLELLVTTRRPVRNGSVH